MFKSSKSSKPTDSSEPYVFRQICYDKYNPDTGNAGGYHRQQAYANNSACYDREARHAHPVAGGYDNPVDFTGCSWFLPPDWRPSDVSAEDYVQAWANYYACTKYKGSGKHEVCRPEGPNGQQVCRSNNLNFSGGIFGVGFEDWPGYVPIMECKPYPRIRFQQTRR